MNCAILYLSDASCTRQSPVKMIGKTKKYAWGDLGFRLSDFSSLSQMGTCLDNSAANLLSLQQDTLIQGLTNRDIPLASKIFQGSGILRHLL